MQYLNWPDTGVPEDPADFIGNLLSSLIRHHLPVIGARCGSDDFVHFSGL